MPTDHERRGFPQLARNDTPFGPSFMETKSGVPLFWLVCPACREVGAYFKPGVACTGCVSYNDYPDQYIRMRLIPNQEAACAIYILGGRNAVAEAVANGLDRDVGSGVEATPDADLQDAGDAGGGADLP